MKNCSYRFILFFAGLFSIPSSWSQGTELAVQTGHSDPVTALDFSAGDVFLASGDANGNIVIWDLLSGKQAQTILAHDHAITDLTFLQDQNLLISSSRDSTIKVWKYFSAELLLEIQFDFAVNDIHLSSNENELAVVGKQVWLLSLFDILNLNSQVFTVSKSQLTDKNLGKRLGIFPKHAFDAVSISPDHKHIVLGGSEEDFCYVLDKTNWQLIKKIPAQVNSLAFNPQSTAVYFTSKHGLAGEVELQGKKRRGTSSDWMLNTFNAVIVDSAMLYLADNSGQISIIDLKKFSLKKILVGDRDRLNAMALSHSGHFLAAAGDQGKITIWDVDSYTPMKELFGAVSQINDFLFSEDGKEILIGYHDGSLRRTHLVSNMSMVNTVSSSSDMMNARFSWSINQILSFNQDSATCLVYKKRKSLDADNTYDKIEAYDVIWYFETNTLTMTKCKNLSGRAVEYMRDRKKGIKHPDDFLLEPRLSDPKNANEFNSNHATSTQTSILTNILTNHDQGNQITCVKYNKAFRFFATAGRDGLIRFWDDISGELLVTFGPFKGGQFIYIHPDGYYFSSKKALDQVSFRKNGRLFAFEQLDILYNRPDLIAARLPYYDSLYVNAYRNAYLKRLKKMNVHESALSSEIDAPNISITRNLEKLITENKVLLGISCVDANNQLDKLHMRVNGVPEFGRFGKEISGLEWKDSFEIELNPGTNYFQIHCVNEKGISSVKESFTVEAHKKDPGSDLYLVSIGVSDYEQKQYNLNFARKDAEDLKNWFSKPFGPFNSTKTKLLVDSQVNRSVLPEIVDFLSPAGVNDVVIIFIAAHGVLDEKLNYFLATHDLDFNNPAEKGISYESLDDLMDRVKSRKKVMFIDACHSGEIDKDDIIKTDLIENEQGDIKFRSSLSFMLVDSTGSFDLAKTLFADMRLNNGTSVISSAGGTEYAIETDQLKNGVFTWCLLYGLSSGSADLNKNRVITLSELQEYLLFEVSKLTGGKQTPTSRVENLSTDFRIK